VRVSRPCQVPTTTGGRDECEERFSAGSTTARLVDGIPPVGGEGSGDESVTTRANREGAARLVAPLAAEHGLASSAEQRSAVGDPAALLGQIAAEEAADVIVVGWRAGGRLRRGLESKLARRLETETPVPVLIAPPRTPRARQAAA
jgi:Universal stress protein family